MLAGPQALWSSVVMRILYGVVGEGMGHATRSRVVLEELVKKHEVHIVVSGRAKEFLDKRFAHVHRIWGLSLAYEGNAVRNWQTVLQNVKGMVTGWPENIRKYFNLIEEFRPDVVISDFESFSYLFGKAHRLPVVSLDNMQIINRCAHDESVLAHYEESFEFCRSLVKSKLPGCFHYLITTFFNPRIRKERTTLVPPLLRPEILDAKTEKGEHLLVYQTSNTNAALPEALKESGRACRIYGVNREISEDLVDENLTYRPFDEKTFIEDLRTSRAVISGGGFTLMSEAVYLHKPVLSLPVEKQFEQTLNALYLERLGYGLHAKQLDSHVIAEFLRRVPACEERLTDYHQEGNSVALAALGVQLENALVRAE